VPNLAPPREPLSAGHLDALRNLARKRDGQQVGWIAIAEAQGLTDLGLARRNRSGWEITASGQATLLLLHSDGAARAEAKILHFDSSLRG
jgi:hypothetical protein